MKNCSIFAEYQPTLDPFRLEQQCNSPLTSATRITLLRSTKTGVANTGDSSFPDHCIVPSAVAKEQYDPSKVATNAVPLDSEIGEDRIPFVPIESLQMSDPL